MSLVVFIVLGVVIGLLARALLPDSGLDSIGTVPAAPAGSVVGGIFVTLLSGSGLREVSSLSIVGSLTGALAVLAVTLAAARRVGI